MRIASLAPEHTIETIYRSLAPMQALAQRGHHVHVEERNAIPDPSTLLDCDVVHVSRIVHPAVPRVLKQLHRHGIGVVWDTDDPMLAVIDEARQVQGRDALMAQRFYSALRSTVRAAHAVTTPSRGLAGFLADSTQRDVQILDNRLPPTFRRPARVMPHEGVRICWHAMPLHMESYEALGMRAMLEELLVRHAHVHVTAIGLDLQLPSRRYTYLQGVPYGTVPGYLAQADIAIVPLAQSAVNEARSDIKLKEYAAVGVPWLASPIGPYAGYGEQQGGRLVADDEWLPAIEALMGDVNARRVLSQRGLRWAAGETIEAHVDAWEQTFEDVAARARSPHTVG